MNFDNIFGEDIYEDGFDSDINKLIIDLKKIFDHNGVEGQLSNLIFASLDFLALNNLYMRDTSNQELLNKVIGSIGVIYAITQTFVATDNDYLDVIDNSMSEYVKKELRNIDKDIELNKINNRIAHLFKDGKYSGERG